MEKTSSKFTKMTAKEIDEINHFPRLTDIDCPRIIAEWFKALDKKVWVKMKYGTLRGVIWNIDIISEKITIKLEDNKEVYIYTYKDVKKNWIKERG